MLKKRKLHFATKQDSITLLMVTVIGIPAIMSSCLVDLARTGFTTTNVAACIFGSILAAIPIYAILIILNGIINLLAFVFLKISDSICAAIKKGKGL